MGAIVGSIDLAQVVLYCFWIFFAGLIYTLIGVAAVVMTTNRPLVPYFFPVVAGVGLLGPIAAVGFYELARRRVFLFAVRAGEQWIEQPIWLSSVVVSRVLPRR